MRNLLLIALAIFSIAGHAAGYVPTEQQKVKAEGTFRSFVYLLSEEKYEKAYELQTDNLKKLMSLKQMLKKKQAGIAIIQTRREQKQMDEFAAMQTRRSTGEFSSGERS